MNLRKTAAHSGIVVSAVLLGVALLGPINAAHAQKKAAPAKAGSMTKAGMAGLEPLPDSVILFPASVGGEGNASAAPTAATREIQEIVSESLQRYLSKGGVGVVIYNRQLPSVQRAVAEGSLKADDAANGPGDSSAKAQRLADMVGASEYLTISVENFKYDAKTHTATFSLNAFRNAADGTPLGTSGQNASGVAPSDVSPRLQQGSATARAADFVAEQTVQALYPQSAPLLNPKKEPARTKKAKGVKSFLVPIAAGVVYFVFA